MDKRYKDGRKLTGFRLSPDDSRKLKELAMLDGVHKSDVVRSLINKSYARRVKA